MGSEGWPGPSLDGAAPAFGGSGSQRVGNLKAGDHDRAMARVLPSVLNTLNENAIEFRRELPPETARYAASATRWIARANAIVTVSTPEAGDAPVPQPPDRPDGVLLLWPRRGRAR